ncbi:unnamed protein product [Didymodactylos carnosus]|uniref:Protein kinase A anchor protein nuclear localisation signal domain-containing protein n=1 Tax=Didymodactylos carnosus TaxID=1234261 RepID=A0A815W6B4_9BILA|nr:unnamed protein product [Didymodactylos carnosus]CAF4398019.1 unnamed protein product [Didymodactylos carnosus]
MEIPQALYTWVLIAVMLCVQSGNTLSKCRVDNRGHAPYRVPTGQSPVVYPPNVKMQPPYSSCRWVPYTNPAKPQTECSEGSQNVLTLVIPLVIHPTFVTAAGLAQVAIKRVSNQSTIIQTEPLTNLHLSINYFDCYSDREVKIIQDVLAKYIFPFMTVTLQGSGCDIDTVQGYIIALATQNSSAALSKLASGIEAAVTAAGVTIKQKSVDRFHMTLATVNYQYPSDCTVKKLKFPKLKSERMYCYLLSQTNGSFEAYAASGSSTVQKSVCETEKLFG